MKYIESFKRIHIIICCVIVMLIISACAQEEEPLGTFNEVSEFELESTSGGMYQSNNGKIKLLTFIFINCPDGVCPMTMADLSVLQDELKEKNWFGTDVELLAITFDPERDDLQALNEYGALFDIDPAGFHVLRGTVEQTEDIASELNFTYGVDQDGSGFHGTTMYLIDEDHNVRSFHRMSKNNEPMDIELIVNHIGQLVNE